MQHRALPGIEAEGVNDPVDLPLVGQVEYVFPLPVSGQTVKLQAEGPVQQQGQAGCEALALGDQPHLAGGEGVAVQQRAVGLRPGAAGPVQARPAQFGFYVAGKRHGVASC